MLILKKVSDSAIPVETPLRLCRPTRIIFQYTDFWFSSLIVKDFVFVLIANTLFALRANAHVIGGRRGTRTLLLEAIQVQRHTFCVMLFEVQPFLKKIYCSFGRFLYPFDSQTRSYNLCFVVFHCNYGWPVTSWADGACIILFTFFQQLNSRRYRDRRISLLFCQLNRTLSWLGRSLINVGYLQMALFKVKKTCFFEI